MTWRSAIIGTMLAGVICVFGYFVHYVAELPTLIGGQFPMIVFSTIVVVMLAVNPLLRLVGQRGVFAPTELAVIGALGLAVCAFGGALYFRHFAGMVTIPTYAIQNNASWQSHQVMAYVPGHVGLLPEGQLLKPHELARKVVAEQDADTMAGDLWRATSELDLLIWIEASDRPGDDALYRAKLTMLINRALSAWALADPSSTDSRLRLMANRRQLQEALPEFFAAPPPGGGIILYDGHFDPQGTGDILLGTPGSLAATAQRVPWGRWWPVIRTWGGLMLLLMTVSICLAVIVRPQWSEHERLPFPIVKFTELVLKPGGPVGLPDIARQRMFWIGFAAVGLHIVNGLHAYFPNTPHVPLRLNFTALQQIAPHMSQMWQSKGLFNPLISLTVVAFGFLLPRPISLTFGITNFMYLLIGAQLLATGVSLSQGEGQQFRHLVNFGAMLAMASFIFYTGRHYYRRLAAAALLRRTTDLPVASVWAARLMVVALTLAVVHFGRAGGSMLFAAFGIMVVLLLWLVNARIVAETGLYRIGSGILPVTVALAFLGPEAVGPTQVIVLTMLSVLLAIELWETPMGFMVTGIELARRTGVSARKMAPAMWSTAAVGFAAAMVVTVVVQYHYGILGRDSPVVYERQILSLNRATNVCSQLAASDALAKSITAGGLARLGSVTSSPWAIGWTLAGVALFAGCSVARLRLPWWPIHPILFVLMGNWGMVTFGASFLLSWLIKTAVVGTGGAKMYHRTVPLMCGLIAAGLVSAIGWTIMGLIYFISTGAAPPSYAAF